MSKYILSTMVQSVSYKFFNGDLNNPTETGKVTILGGASIPSATSGIGDMVRAKDGTPIWTANGVVTTLTDAQYDLVKDHHIFKKHIESGLLKVINHDITGSNREIDKHAATMQDDGFKQLTPETLKQRIKVKTGSPEEDQNFRL